MLIRTASAEELLALWGCPDGETASPTARFFCSNIASGNAVFWTLEHDGALIGELYAFFSLEDSDFADGKDVAYLCAFRVKKEYRGRGLGSRLMETALADLKARGFRRVTIGVGPDEPQNIRLYRRFGFTEKIKDCYDDPCARDENMLPVHEEQVWWLLSKTL